MQQERLIPLVDEGLGNTVIRHDDRYRLNFAVIDSDLRAPHSAVHDAGYLPQLKAEPPPRLAAGWEWPWLTSAREALRRDNLDLRAALATRSAADPEP
jgi:hypothetical protein